MVQNDMVDFSFLLFYTCLEPLATWGIRIWGLFSCWSFSRYLPSTIESLYIWWSICYLPLSAEIIC
jgi:hypothetical protein